MKKSQLYESPVTFRTEGSGPPLVLLHGFGGNHSHWNAMMPLLAKHYRVILPNLGPLTLGAFEITFSEQVEFLQEFKRAVFKEFGPMTVAGISYGGALAWAMAFEDDGAIQNLILINTMPPDPMKHIQSRSLKRLLWLGRHHALLSAYMLTPLAFFDFKAVAFEIRVDWINRKPKLTDIFSRRQKMLFYMIERFAWVVFKESWPQWLKKFKRIKIPALILYGDQDKVFNEAEAKWLASNLEFSTVEKISGGTHMCIHSSPNAVFEAMKKFILEKNKKVS